MKYLLFYALLISPLLANTDTQEGEKIVCDRYLDYVVRCTANGVTCYEDEETGERFCFTDLATIKL